MKTRLPWSIALIVGLLACSPSAPVAQNAETSASAEPPTPEATTSGSAAAPPRPPREAVAVPKEIQELIDAKERSPEDRALDAGRHPAELLAFFDIAKGMTVAELGSGGGYTSELLARAVGPKGKVYGQNTKFILDKFAQKPWTERLKKPWMKSVVRVDREFESPFAPEVKDVDVVLMVLFYHDLYWMKVDRAQMNLAVFKALKPGGVFGIVDHSAKTGAGSTQTESLHRVEESLVKKEIEEAGFVLERTGGFLRTPEDQLDWSTSPGAAGEKRGTSDRFVLLFRKPK